MDVDLGELQGNILRSYGRTYRAVRHLVLEVADARAARAALASMTDGDRSTPDVTTADRFPREDGFGWCLNVGFTWRGLQALGLPKASLATFPPEFRAGMAARAGRLGDVGASAPEHWIAGLGESDRVHVVVTIHGHGHDDVVDVSEQVLGLAGGRAFAPLPGGPLDGATFTGAEDERRVHFGYRDGISQPRFDGVHGDGPGLTPVGAVLLDHPAPLPDVRWKVPGPDPLGGNGTFNAFRVLGQDVAGFEAFLEAEGGRLACDPEEVAAKLCGRWRDGAPLVLAPTQEDANHFAGDLNAFGYRDVDPDGRRCPIGSHIRRTNPRDAHIVQRGTNDFRTLVRRGMPFGPRYEPASAEDAPVPRGLLGNFICASLSAQFEAMQADWLNLGLLDPRITGTNDPLAGANDGATTTASWTTAAGDDAVVRGLPRFVTTLGGAYCFLPSLPALRWLATSEQLTR